MRRFLVAGNWKMNTTKESGAQLAQALAAEVPSENPAVEVLVCPPFPYLT
ncbi:MAG: triose-phosphate isomerase, partial [Planctomycetaceae bacterium]|nr:triose-phosphate isomerase [Planctomycetaceae bacterium]